MTLFAPITQLKAKSKQATKTGQGLGLILPWYHRVQGSLLLSSCTHAQSRLRPKPAYGLDERNEQTRAHLQLDPRQTQATILLPKLD